MHPSDPNHPTASSSSEKELDSMLSRTAATLFDRAAGSSAFIYRLNEGRKILSALPSLPPTAFLITLPNEGREVGEPEPKLINQGLTVGRSSTCDWEVADLRQKISGQHFRVVLTEDGYLLRDLNSTNGTFVNENTKPIRSTMLCDGDVIVAGGRKFLFSLGAHEHEASEG